MRNTVGITLLLLIGMTACDQKNDDAIERITASLRQDLQDSGLQITNALSLIDDISVQSNEPMDLIVVVSEDMMNDTTNMEEKTEITRALPLVLTKSVSPPVVLTESVIVPETTPMISQTTKIRTSIESAPLKVNNVVRENLYIIQQESYIKVGDDKSSLRVSTRKSQKITVAVFPENYSAMVDIYLYAIPINSKLVRNNNTLIGYAKNLEFINQQAQFTRYWLAKRADGRLFKSRAYNIYVEYHYKDSRGRIFNKIGRYWGGSHRNWIVTVE